MSVQMLEASLLGVGTVLRLEKDAWSNGQITKASNKWVHPPPTCRSPALVAKTRRAPSRHSSRNARVYGHTTAAMHKSSKYLP